MIVHDVRRMICRMLDSFFLVFHILSFICAWLGIYCAMHARQSFCKVEG
jgi:hypothetical protein